MPESSATRTSTTASAAPSTLNASSARSDVQLTDDPTIDEVIELRSKDRIPGEAGLIPVWTDCLVKTAADGKPYYALEHMVDNSRLDESTTKTVNEISKKLNKLNKNIKVTEATTGLLGLGPDKFIYISDKTTGREKEEWISEDDLQARTIDQWNTALEKATGSKKYLARKALRREVREAYKSEGLLAETNTKTEGTTMMFFADFPTVKDPYSAPSKISENGKSGLSIRRAWDKMSDKVETAGLVIDLADLITTAATGA